MLLARIRIDGRDHFLPRDYDAEAIMSRITEQVRAGGGFVEILRTPSRVLSVLVSPGLNMSIELTDVEDERPAPEEEPDELEPSFLGPIDLF